MGEVEKNSLLFWCQKIVNDPNLLAEDPRGNKFGSDKFSILPGENVTTFCNIAVQRICRGLDYNKFDDMVADDMHAYMLTNWILPVGTLGDRMAYAYGSAMVGDIAILSWLHIPHGHVAVAVPVEPMLFSGKWNCYVPKVANVGEHNDFMGANYAFTEAPDVFVLGRTLS